MTLEFKTSDDGILKLEDFFGELIITDIESYSVKFPLEDLPRFIHELQIIANQFTDGKVETGG